MRRREPSDPPRTPLSCGAKTPSGTSEWKCGVTCRPESKNWMNDTAPTCPSHSPCRRALRRCRANSARRKTVRISDSNPTSFSSTHRTRCGKDGVHYRYGTCGSTRLRQHRGEIVPHRLIQHRPLRPPASVPPRAPPPVPPQPHLDRVHIAGGLPWNSAKPALGAYSGEAGHLFRTKPITDSGKPITDSGQADHPRDDAGGIYFAAFLAPVKLSALRMDSPPSLRRWALWTSLSQMASARVASPMMACQSLGSS
jgi:hypothetical protein